MLGDNHGEACAPEFTAAAERWFRTRGLRVLRNQPYAGGFITEHYGNPSAGWHALQIEINRGLYLEEQTILRGDGFSRLQQDLSRVAKRLSTLVGDLSGDRAAAAE